MPAVVEIAPNACIVCGKPAPAARKAGWIYIAGSIPVGALACSEPCLHIALDRANRTGRTDGAARAGSA